MREHSRTKAELEFAAAGELVARGWVGGTRARKTLCLERDGQQVTAITFPAEVEGPIALQVALAAPHKGRCRVAATLTAQASGRAVLQVMGVGSVAARFPLTLTLRPVLADLGETITFDRGFLATA